jgi:hypothetical protein
MGSTATSAGSDAVVFTISRTCAKQISTATGTAASSGSGNVVVVNLGRQCAKQLLLALTLALGGTPVKQITKGKGKSKK